MGGWCLIIAIFCGLVLLLDQPMKDLKLYLDGMSTRHSLEHWTEENAKRLAQLPKPIVPRKDFNEDELWDFEVREKFREYFWDACLNFDGWSRDSTSAVDVLGEKINDYDNDIWYKFQTDENIYEYVNHYLRELSYSEYFLVTKEREEIEIIATPYDKEWNGTNKILDKVGKDHYKIRKTIFRRNPRWIFIELLVKKSCQLYNIEYRMDYIESDWIPPKYNISKYDYVKYSFESQEEVDRFFKTFDTCFSYYERKLDEMISQATNYQKLIFQFNVLPAYDEEQNEVKNQFKELSELRRMAKKLKKPYAIGF